MTETTEKKVAPKKDATTISLTNGGVAKNKAVAFLNWEFSLANGDVYKSDRGFPIFQNPKYPNPKEDTLIELARANDGIVELTMKVRIALAKQPTPTPELSQFIIG